LSSHTEPQRSQKSTAGGFLVNSFILPPLKSMIVNISTSFDLSSPDLACRRARTSSVQRAAFFVLVLAVAAALAEHARADGGGGATDLATASGKVWTTVPGGVVPIAPRTGRIAGSPVSTGPLRRIAGGGNALWGLRPWTLVRIDPGTGAVRPTAIHGPAYALAAAFGSVWIPSYEDGRLTRVDARTGHVVASIAGVGNAAEAIAAGFGSVWVASVGPWRKGRGGVMVPYGPGSVTRIDPTTNRVVARIGAGRGAGAIAVGEGAVWVASFRGVGADNTVTRIDPRTNRVVATVRPGGRPAAIGAGAGYAWVVGDELLVRIDPKTNRVRRRSTANREPSAVTIFSGAVWVANSGASTVSRIDPRTLAVATVGIPRLALPPPSSERAGGQGDNRGMLWIIVTAIGCGVAVLLALALRRRPRVV
jgi:DNA-binding beta-propeller fold protein YncE